MVSAKSLSDLRHADCQTNQPKLPIFPKPNFVPKRGILKMARTGTVPDRFVKPNQGVRAKQFRRRSSFELPMPEPKLNQVSFAKDLTSTIIFAFENDKVIEPSFFRNFKEPVQMVDVVRMATVMDNNDDGNMTETTEL
jgi:hypothetical protein